MGPLPQPGPSSEYLGLCGWGTKSSAQRPSPRPCSPLPTATHWGPTTRSLAASLPAFLSSPASPLLFLTRSPVTPRQTPGFELSCRHLPEGPCSPTCGVTWSGPAWPWGTRTSGQCPQHMQSQAHHHPARPGAAKAVMVEGLQQPCREPWTADHLFPHAGWAGAGKRSFVQEQRQCRRPQSLVHS